jgi:hypothetical protein
MLPSSTSTFYVRRGDKTLGPFAQNQIQGFLAAKKLLPTDLIAERSDGPWVTIANRFSQPSSSGQQSHEQKPSEQRQHSIQNGVRLTNGEGAISNSVPPVSPAAAAAGAPIKQSPWKFAIIGILAVSALLIVGIMGLSLLLVVAVIALANRGDVAETAQHENASQLSDPIADPASLPSGAPDNASSTDTQSGDDLLKVMAELHAALERAGQQSDTDAGNPSPVLMSTDGADSSELSEELLALSSKEATDLAIQYLLSADQADHGRTAFLLLDRASTAGDGRAMYFLFLCYLKGIGHPEDRAEALHWLQQSAESGDAIGMYAYSTAIRLGDYEGLDESDAVMWLNRSASVGHQPAINELERMRVAGALEALLSGMGANDDAEAPDYACAGAYGFFEHCPCEGFRPGGGTSQDPDPFLCKSCGHSMQDHYR